MISGKQIVKITEKQVEHFVGNMLQVLGKDDKPITVMSQAAYDSLTPDQLQILEKEATFCQVILAPLKPAEEEARDV